MTLKIKKKWLEIEFRKSITKKRRSSQRAPYLKSVSPSYIIIVAALFRFIVAASHNQQGRGTKHENFFCFHIYFKFTWLQRYIIVGKPQRKPSRIFSFSAKVVEDGRHKKAPTHWGPVQVLFSINTCITLSKQRAGGVLRWQPRWPDGSRRWGGRDGSCWRSWRYRRASGNRPSCR